LKTLCIASCGLDHAEGLPHKTSMTDDEIEDLLSAAFRDGAVAWPPAVPDAVADRIVALADFHGVASLLHLRLAASEGISRLVREGLHDRAIGWAMQELGERQALASLIPALNSRGVRPLLFKGAALAYSHYDDPAVRQRGDTDILIGAGERAAAHDAFTELGWRKVSEMAVEVSTRQTSYILAGPSDAMFHVDLHWRICNSTVLHRQFKHDELWGRSVPLPLLHPQARGAHPVDALLIACMHRLVHLRTPFYLDGAAWLVPNPNRLIWLMDMHLLAEAFSPEEWQDFERRACEKGLADACRDGLLRAKTLLGAPCPEPVLKRLAASESTEAPDRYLRASCLRREWMDFLALRGVAGKIRFLSEVIFPPADFMRRRYSGGGRGWLPWLYLRRAAGGISKRLRGRPSSTRPR